MTVNEVLQRDFVYWDISSCEVVLEKSGMKPSWGYIELWKGNSEGIITEYYKDGNLRLNFSYEIDSPQRMVAGNRISLFKNNKGNWTKYMVLMPTEEFEKTVKQYYFGD